MTPNPDNPHDTDDGAALLDLLPMSIATLVVGLLDVLSEAEDLPQPCYITIHDSSQSFDLQFPPARESLKALTRWALRFGAVLTSEPHDSGHGPQTWCQVKFDYLGVAATAYAHIPAETADT